MNKKSKFQYINTIIILLVVCLIGYIVYISVYSNKKNNDTIDDQFVNSEIIGDYLILYYGEKGSEQYARIYENDFSLVKEIDNICDLEKIIINNTTLYVSTVDLGRGGDDYYGKILDDKFNILIDGSNLFEDGSFYFSVNSLNNTISVSDTVYGHSNKIFVYNFNGKLVKEISHDNILGMSNNYFVVKENNEIILMNYENEKVITIPNSNLYVDLAYRSEYSFDLNWNEDSKSFSIVLEDKDFKCYKYTYYQNTNKISLVSTFECVEL